MTARSRGGGTWGERDELLAPGDSRPHTPRGGGSPACLGDPRWRYGATLDLHSPSSDIDRPTLAINSPSLATDSPTLAVDSLSLAIGPPSLDIDRLTLDIDSPSLAIDSPTLDIGRPTLSAAVQGWTSAPHRSPSSRPNAVNSSRRRRSGRLTWRPRGGARPPLPRRIAARGHGTRRPRQRGPRRRSRATCDR
jgi:hypothetical protein